MHPQLLDLVCEAIAAGACPLDSEADLHALLAALERLTRGEGVTRLVTVPAPKSIRTPPRIRARSGKVRDRRA